MKGQVALTILIALLSACATPRVPPPAAKFADDVLSGRIDLETYDFGRAGYWALSPEERLQWRAGIDQRLFGATLTSNTCDPGERRRFAAAMWQQLLVTSPDEVSWRESWKALRHALELHDADLLAAREAVPRGTDERVTELARRVAQDQLIRQPTADVRWAADLPAAARGPWQALKLSRMMAIDCRNTEWLARQMGEIGWFDVVTYGAKADKDAWLLVQHADRTPQFQKSTLAHLRTLGPDRTDPRNVAYLEDRVASAENRPQRYGTQGRCEPDGRWKPLPIEESDGIDARRAALGLPPMAEYSKGFEGVCPKDSPTAPP